jgi:hypothetical protein
VPSLLYLVPPLAGTGISIILLVLVLTRDFKTAANRVFSLLLLSMGLWGLLLFLMRISPDVEQALFWNQIVFPTGYALFIFYYHFTCLYTHRPNRLLTWFAYLVLITICVISPTGLLVDYITKESYGYAPHYISLAIYIISLAGFFFVVLGLVNLVKAYRSTTNYEGKNTLVYMITAIIILMLFGIFDTVPRFPPMGIYGNILFGVLTTVSLVKYHLLDIHVAIRKGTAYFLLSTSVAIPYIGVVVLFSTIFDQDVPVWIHIIILVLAAISLQPLWRKVQTIVDKWFFRERYDFLKELEIFSLQAHDISGLEQLIISLSNIMSQALQTSRVYILTKDETGDYRSISTTNEGLPEVIMDKYNPIINWMEWSEPMRLEGKG